MPGSTGGQVSPGGGDDRQSESPLTHITVNSMAEGICSVNPGDLVMMIDNLVDRLLKAEQEIAELKAANQAVNQLSDLGQQVGWVGGVTYMGVSGWTQTEYGTLIPPPGVSLSSLGITIPNIGQAVQMVVMDANGNPVFGADLLGQLFGSQVTAWNNAAGALMDYAYYYGGSSSSRGITISTSATQIAFTVSQDGLYLIGGTATHYPEFVMSANVTGGGFTVANSLQNAVLSIDALVYSPNPIAMFPVTAGNNLVFEKGSSASASSLYAFAVRISSL